MFKVGVTPDFYVEARQHLEPMLAEQLAGRKGIECSAMPGTPGKPATPEAVDQFDAIFALAVPFDASSVREVQRLAVIARWGVGYDMIDVEALTAAGVMLCITPDAVKRPVAEAILTLIFALSKNLFALDRATRLGRWRADMKALGGSLPGKTIGSVGCGNIARELFTLARPLGFTRLLACDPYVQECPGVELVDMATIFRESDFVTVNTLFNVSTRGLIGEREFRAMKPSAYFINTSRGPIVQHDALVRALREDWIAGAGIDVFPVEPVPADDPLLSLENVIVSPHALAWTDSLMRDNGREAFANVFAISRGEIPHGVVNREVISHPAFQKKLERFRNNNDAD